MSAPQRKRFVCPLCEDTRLAPSRMARDDVRRFCLECSERTGKLVARVSPVLEQFGALRDRTNLIKKYTASTDYDIVALRRLGYVGGSEYRDELRRAGVTLLQPSVNSDARYVLWTPAWAHSLLTEGTHTKTRGSALKMIRYLAHDAKSRDALRAAMATGDRPATLQLVLDLYPFPVAEALRDAIRGLNA